MSKVVDITQRFASQPVEFDDADDVLDALLKLNDNQMMVVFNEGGELRYTIQTITGRFKVDI